MGEIGVPKIDRKALLKWKLYISVHFRQESLGVGFWSGLQ